MHIYSIQKDSDQTTIFSGYSLPKALPDYISTEISRLACISGLKYIFLWLLMRPFAHGCKQFDTSQAVSYLTQEIQADALFAATDDSEGFKLDFKLALHRIPECGCEFLTSFKAENSPSEEGWVQRAFTVVRRGRDAYCIFFPKRD